jgi:hypothetical protein
MVKYYNFLRDQFVWVGENHVMRYYFSLYLKMSFTSCDGDGRDISFSRKIIELRIYYSYI